MPIELEVSRDAISEHVLLIGSLLGDQSFQGAAQQLLVALGPGPDDVDRQVSPGQDGSEAGMTGDCGEAPRLTGASTEEQRPELKALLFALALWALMAIEISIFCGRCALQRQRLWPLPRPALAQPAAAGITPAAGGSAPDPDRLSGH